jgi:hypothetical protein
LLSLTRFTHLASLALRLTDRQPFPAALIEEIVEMHGTHLRSVRLMGFTLGSQDLESLMECEGLEKLAVSVSAEDIVSSLWFCQRVFSLEHISQYTFASSLAGTTSLHTLIDVVDHGAHGKQMSLTTDRVRVLLEDVPSLTRVISENRLWTVRGHDRMQLSSINHLWSLTFGFLLFNLNSEPTHPIWTRDTTGADESFEGNWVLVYTAP